MPIKVVAAIMVAAGLFAAGAWVGRRSVAPPRPAVVLRVRHDTVVQRAIDTVRVVTTRWRERVRTDTVALSRLAQQDVGLGPAWDTVRALLTAGDSALGVCTTGLATCQRRLALAQESAAVTVERIRADLEARLARAQVASRRRAVWSALGGLAVGAATCAALERLRP